MSKPRYKQESITIRSDKPAGYESPIITVAAKEEQRREIAEQVAAFEAA